ncbi:response regulator [Saccharibacillus sp. CPCC 101409]|uniref:response regulator n=1 Tax=Saccharibacillus sp. CPCC 101409 TaxID=3058041 RepID=UPI00267396BF|nr:response regulator [Saccharibacillus sp. CPCC 101409]MDO3410213.1 response regulator [Saccharibacillus sp. CPCC 101409]
MRELLIVDDEKNIRQGLQAMIGREFGEACRVRLAANGREALEMHAERPAEIVITDIRMPIMDGMELLAKLRAERRASEGPIVLVLSGYDEFEYAKTAIRFQVRDYLLKPIRREDLFEALGRAFEELERRDSASEQQEAAIDYKKRLRLARLGQLLEAKNEREAAQILGDFSAEEAGIALPFYLGVVTYRYEQGGSMSREELEAVVERLDGPPFDAYQAALWDREGRLVLVDPSPDRFARLAELAEKRELGGLLIGIGPPGRRLENLPACYRSASRALKYTFLHPGVRRVNALAIEGEQGERRMFPLPEEEVRLLGNLLGTDRKREMGDLLYRIFRIDQLARIDIDYIEQAARLINERLLDEVFRQYGEASMEVLKLYRKVGDWNNFRYFHDYFRGLENLLSSLNDYIKQVRLAYTENENLKEAVAFIETHYARPLNMATVSNHVSLNYSYFSEAFKAYTGESFVVYLKKVRIEHAKELLSGYELKLSEVGEAVGFENAKQFARVFKELEGISPHEYRSKVHTQQTP